MASKSWKQWEAFVGSLFGWKRNMGSGRINRHDDGTPTIGDVRTPDNFRNLNLECKSYQRFAVVSMFQNIKREAPEKTLFLFLHQKRKQYEDSLVVMDVPTFRIMWQASKHLFETKEKEEKKELDSYSDPLGLLGDPGENEAPKEVSKPKRPKRSS